MARSSGRDWSRQSAELQRQQIDRWFDEAIIAMKAEGDRCKSEPEYVRQMDDGAHYLEMARMTFREKLGKQSMEFKTVDLGL